jgi:microcystin-dependent protein
MKKTWKSAAVLGGVMLAGLTTASARETFVGEIFWTGATFCPRGSAEANGQLLPIAQNTSLFSLIGTVYGGDGRTTFQLPDLRGRMPMHVGSGIGLTPRGLGERGGAEAVSLTEQELPAHSHNLKATSDRGNSSNPSGAALADGRTSRVYRSGAVGVTGTMDTRSNEDAGGGEAHENMPPFAVVRACIALQGVFPSRN